ncbi:MAG: hypothetical protein ACRCX8_13860 [Sarcina sp.]
MIKDHWYHGKAIINKIHEVKFEFDEYYSLCMCPYCDEGYLKTYWKYCPMCGEKIETIDELK